MILAKQTSLIFMSKYHTVESTCHGSYVLEPDLKGLNLPTKSVCPNKAPLSDKVSVSSYFIRASNSACDCVLIVSATRCLTDTSVTP